MKGLLLKDLKSLGGQSKTLLLLMLFYGGISVYSGNASMFASMMCVLGAMLPITAMSYDEKAHWDGFALTMPVSRKMLVLSKYLLALVLVLGIGALSTAVTLLVDKAPQESLLASLILVSGGLIYESIIFPILFKKGVEKGRLLMMIVLFVPVLGIVAISQFADLPEISETSMSAFAVVVPVIAAVLFALSAAISCKIYAKKEF